MAVNPPNNNLATEIAQAQEALANLPNNASEQDRQLLQTRLEQLQKDRGAVSNNQTPQAGQTTSTGNAILDNAIAILNSLVGLFSGSANPHERILNSQRGVDDSSEATQEAVSAPLETEPKRTDVISRGSALKAMFTGQLSANKERLVADMKREDIGAKAAKPAT